MFYVRYIGKKIPPFSAISLGSLSLNCSMLNNGKRPKPGGRLCILPFSGTRTVRIKETSKEDFAVWTDKVSREFSVPDVRLVVTGLEYSLEKKDARVSV